ncbi:Cullin repeat-like-containing domain protein [Radiomyces spectabilis]|uniref:Cullin repeat-like-containing domain protein n=1 Tax=Radiomyces spectabilis TaxID=64574 RepID=UPI0022208904|nr:Cullin repeat-like-containing domain protein [Radiomyces spectabilis]KAI8384379.1 Cullin repeat-like-containing domain protein [Radiomyces spectabilis]
MKPANPLRSKSGGSSPLKKKDKINRPAYSPSPPSIPTQSMPSSSSRPSRLPASNFPLTKAPIALDLHRFADSNLQPEEFVRRSLGDANEEEIRGFHKSLIEAKHVVGGDLQRNVYRNYTEFVTISKEISNLDSDVLNLKEYLNELRSIWDGFQAMAITLEDSTPMDGIPVNTTVSSSRKRNDYITTDMQSIYRARMMALWENVEGSQRFIPYIQDRRLIRECVNFWDIHPQTFKPRQAVHIFLLNDCILIAYRKKRTMSTQQKLVAEHCWNFREMTIVDVKDTDDLKNAVKFVVYPNVYLYQSERPDDKTGLLQAYRSIKDEMDDTHQIIPSQFNIQKDIATKESPEPEEKKIQFNPTDEKWLNDLPDELEVMIALREFEEAVVAIEKASALFAGCGDATTLQDMRKRVQHYTESLCDLICQDLGNTLLTKLQFQRFVNWLLRLNKGEQAREMFLKTRSLIIKKRIRQLVFEGDITTYIGELALVVFTLIRNTCEWYRDSFRQNDMASGFVTWVREQAEVYAAIYKRQVFNNSQLSCQAIAECFKSTLDQCAVLRKVGLDLKFLLEDLFMENIKETVLIYQKKCMDKVNRFVKNDNFLVVTSQNLGPDVKVTSSVVSFYNLLIKFVNDICLLAKLRLYTTVIDCVSQLTEFYLRSMVEESKKKDLSKDQRSLAFLNVSFILDNAVPRVSSQLNVNANLLFLNDSFFSNPFL